MSMMSRARVLDKEGKELAPCPLDKARRMLSEGRAALVSREPLTIQLPYAVELPARAEETKPGEGKKVLLHVCCGPCATYTVKRLKEEGFDVAGLWYNPNIQPFSEHETRRVSAVSYLESLGVSLVGENGYQMPQFLRLVAGHEAREERCQYCYEMRLGRTAALAARQGFDAMTTTLLISPYQDQELIREIGEREAKRRGVEFYFENFRRGWSERGRVTREHGLYRQQYCGCVYSEWERHTGLEVSSLLLGNDRE
jgi:predicted adenine nucleotide alpha hydrolase (AANH) superfamily ATPase